MRVSLVSAATEYPDADALAHLASFLMRRGDEVRLFAAGHLPDAPPPLPELTAGLGLTAADLLERTDFGASDLYIYHCAGEHPVLDSLFKLDRGLVILWLPSSAFQCDRQASGHSISGQVVRLASASDLIVVDGEPAARQLQESGATEPRRLHIVPPAVSVSAFTPGPPDLALARDLGFLGKRVLLFVREPNEPASLDSLRELMGALRSQFADFVLAIAPAHTPVADTRRLDPEYEGVHWLAATDDLRPYYRLADILLAETSGSASRQRALEAMACGVPALPLEVPTGQLIERITRLLRDDAAYGEAVRGGLETASRHSLESFELAWGAVVADACGWLPVRLAPRPAETQNAPATGATAQPISGRNEEAGALLGIDIEQLKAMASVTLRDYEVRSPTPFFGPFIAWVRRNLTSHLRKPYLDPALDRQEAFNLRAANALEDLAARLASYQQSLAERNHIPTQAIDPQVFVLLDQVDDVIDTIAASRADSAQVDLIRSALAEIRGLLAPQAAEARLRAED